MNKFRYRMAKKHMGILPFIDNNIRKSIFSCVMRFQPESNFNILLDVYKNL